MNKNKKIVVIDAANILRDDRGCIIRDEDGNRLTQMRPERLISVLRFVEENGGEPIALLRNGTYHSGRKKSNTEDPRYGDWGLVEAAISSNKVQRVSDEDDMYCVHYALQNEALIISRDKFRDHKKLNPELDWDRVSELKISDYNFIKGDFVSPSLLKNLSKSDPQEVIEQIEYDNDADALQPTGTVGDDNNDQPSHIDEITDTNDVEVDEIILLDELYAILYSLTSDDGQCNLSAVVNQLAGEFLNQEGNPLNNNWPAGWTVDLKKYVNSITNDNRKVTTWIRDNLPSGFEIRNGAELIRFG